MFSFVILSIHHTHTIIPSDTLTIESIDLCDLSALVVATEKCDLVRVLSFQGEELCKCFQAVVATVNKVTLRERKW